MAEQTANKNPSKSHPNDSETQINASMKGKEPNTQADAEEPKDNYVVKDGKVINEKDGSQHAMGEDDEELARIAAHLNDNPAPTDTAGRPVGDNAGRTATK